MSSLYHPRLKELTKHDVKRLSLKGKDRHAKVVYICDGSTCDLAFYLDEEKDKLVKFKCNMSGYDASKLSEASSALARDYLAYLCTGGDVVEPADFCDRGMLSKKDMQKKLGQSKRLVLAEFGRNGKDGRPVVTMYQTLPRGHPPPAKRDKGSINDVMTTFVDELEQRELISSQSQDWSESSSDSTSDMTLC